MKRLIAMLGCAVLMVATPALAQTKTVRGSVTNVGANTITVNVTGKDMTFNVDTKTTVVARGASTKSRQAQAAGKTGPGITDVLKAGEAVEVVYHEKEMHADTVRAISGGGGGRHLPFLGELGVAAPCAPRSPTALPS